nr:cytochrome c [Gammaproteobacteria bacterium]
MSTQALLRLPAGLALLAVALLGPLVSDAADVVDLYQQHCASCHAPDRLGAMGPALLPEGLARLRKADAVETVTKGRAATQMQGFADRLSAEEIGRIVDW